MTDWLDLLKSSIATDPRGISGVAARLGYSRPAVSRVLAGTYGDTRNIATAVQRLLARIDCPHLGASLAPAECRAYAARSYSAISAADVPHWRACKKCPHKPEES